MNTTEQCACCGKFVSYEAMASGRATVKIVPDSHFGPEEIEWLCPRCASQERATNIAPAKEITNAQ